TPDTRMLVGYALVNYRPERDALEKNSYRIRTQDKLVLGAGSARYSGVWSKAASERDRRFGAIANVEWYEHKLSPGRLQTDVRLVPSDPLAGANAWRQIARSQLARVQKLLQPAGFAPTEPKARQAYLDNLFWQGVAHFRLGEEGKALTD